MAGYLSDVNICSNASPSRLYKIIGNVFPSLFTSIGDSSQNICVDKNGVVWASNSNSGTTSKIINGVKVLDIITPSPTGICVDGNNVVWVASWIGACIYKIDNDVVTTFPIGACSNICADKDNAVWVVKSATINKIVNGIEVLSAPSANCIGICCDKNNVIWVANWSGNYVSKFVNGMKILDIPVGTGPRGICIDRNNAVWVVSGNYISKDRKSVV